MSRSKDHQQGFTLVELMIVVAIVGILAVLATVGYRRYIASSKYSEASQMVNAIRIAQETVKAETGAYVNLGSARPCPFASIADTGKNKMGWDPTCSGGNGTWNRLPVHTDGPVYFGYATYSGAANTAIPAAGIWDGTVNGQTTFPDAPAMEWYVVVGVADIDRDGAPGHVIGSSMSNQIFIDNEGS